MEMLQSPAARVTVWDDLLTCSLFSNVIFSVQCRGCFRLHPSYSYDRISQYFFSRVSNYHYRAHRCVLKKLLWTCMDVNFCLPTYLQLLVRSLENENCHLPTSSYISSSRHTHKKIGRYLSESGVSVKKSFSSSQLFWGPSQTTITRSCPLLTTYPSLVDICEGIRLLKQGKVGYR